MTNDPLVESALNVLAPESEPDLERALRQQLAMQAGERPSGWGRIALLSRSSRVRYGVAGLAAAAALILTLSAPPVRGFAAQFLPLFRVQDVTPITIDNITQPMPNLTKLGDMTPSNPGASAFRPVQQASVADASKAAQFNVLTPSKLPSGLQAQPLVGTTQAQTVSFTFRAAKARAYLDSIGQPNFALPPKFDGATLQLHIEPAVSLAYLPAGTDVSAVTSAVRSIEQSDNGSSAAANAQTKEQQKAASSTINNLLNGSGVFIVETKSPSLDAQGVTADELRSFLLSLPGLTANEKAQLSAIGDWTHTLPVPASASASLHKVSVNGAPGVAGKNGGAEMALWVNNGMLYVATAPKLDENTLLSLASSMK
ncbi:MAG: hypothetical protein JO247_11225 [Chloroflexi bacterium]|nr:hypothetical protein [Chloroflexota bacterium]